jgi:hypothetical protein
VVSQIVIEAQRQVDLTPAREKVSDRVIEKKESVGKLTDKRGEGVSDI